MAFKIRSAIIIAALTMTACSNLSDSQNWYSLRETEQDQPSFLESGSISISRPVPQFNGEPARVMAFMPVLPEIPELPGRIDPEQKLSVVIDVTSKTISVKRGTEELIQSDITASEDLTKGEFSVTLKQASPLWYAPDDYFLMRGQEPPIEGSSERYRKGALGSYAIFLNDGVIIHSSPIPDPLINGFLLDDDKITSIYSILEPGMRIIVQ